MREPDEYFSAVGGAGTVTSMASAGLAAGHVTSERYWQLVEDGVIRPDDRVELLEGVIVSMSPQNPPHAFAVAKLTRILTEAVGDEASIRVQLPLNLGKLSTPEPDLAVVAGRHEDYAAVHPTSALLAIEVADSSLLQDRLTKGPIYAAAGIGEYWLVNLRDRCVEVHRDPDREQRRYTTRQILTSEERLEPAALPRVSIPIAEILPSRIAP